MKINLFNRTLEDSCNGDITGIPMNVRDLQGFLFYGGVKIMDDSVDSLKKTLDDFIIWICTASWEERQRVLTTKLAEKATAKKDKKNDSPARQIKKIRTPRINTVKRDEQFKGDLKVIKCGLYKQPEPKVIGNDSILTVEGKAWLREQRAKTEHHENV